MMDACDSILEEKYAALLSSLSSMEGVAVAFSGGVDSTLLLHAAREALGDNAVAIIADSRLFPRKEIADATGFCESRAIPCFVVETHELEDAAFVRNSSDRCYLCKTELLGAVIAQAHALGIDHVVEGSNLDDDKDYRPGSRAVCELGVQSPLRQAGLTKDDIRLLSKVRNLTTWNKPSLACLASRIAFDEPISNEKLSMIEEAECYLRDLGITQARVRLHGPIARIEVLPEEMPLVAGIANRNDIVTKLRQLGFTYITLDLAGYKTGSMNKTG